MRHRLSARMCLRGSIRQTLSLIIWRKRLVRLWIRFWNANELYGGKTLIHHRHTEAQRNPINFLVLFRDLCLFGEKFLCRFFEQLKACGLHLVLHEWPASRSALSLLWARCMRG